jgi:hypothetical protein
LDFGQQPAQIKGRVEIYTGHKDSHLEMTIKHEVTKTLAPILENLAIKYSPVKSVYRNFIFIFETYLISEENQCIYVEEDKLWELKGWFKAAVQQDDEIEWFILDNKFSLKLLIVCFRNSG